MTRGVQGLASVRRTAASTIARETIAHHRCAMAVGQEREVIRESCHALPPGARQLRDVGSPEEPTCAVGPERTLQEGMDVGIWKGRLGKRWRRTKLSPRRCRDARGRAARDARTQRRSARPGDRAKVSTWESDAQCPPRGPGVARSRVPPACPRRRPHSTASQARLRAA